MNLPNKITVARILFIPLMIIIPFFGLDNILFGGVTLGNFIVLIIFLIASFTDFLDGYLARKNNQVTDTGKMLDAIADKVLVNPILVILSGSISSVICVHPSRALSAIISTPSGTVNNAPIFEGIHL